MNRSELPADLEAFVQQELAEGKYPSEAELVADALRLLRERQRSHEGHPENGVPHTPIWEVFKNPQRHPRRRDRAFTPRCC